MSERGRDRYTTLNVNTCNPRARHAIPSNSSSNLLSSRRLGRATAPRRSLIFAPLHMINRSYPTRFAGGVVNAVILAPSISQCNASSTMHITYKRDHNVVFPAYGSHMAAVLYPRNRSTEQSTCDKATIRLFLITCFKISRDICCRSVHADLMYMVSWSWL